MAKVDMEDVMREAKEAVEAGFGKAGETLVALSDTLQGIIDVGVRAKERDEGQTVEEIKAVVEEGLQRVRKLRDDDAT